MSRLRSLFTVISLGLPAFACAVSDDGYQDDLYDQLADADMTLREAIVEARDQVPGPRPIDAKFSPGLSRGSFEVRMYDQVDDSLVLVRFDSDGVPRMPWRRSPTVEEVDDALVLAKGIVTLRHAITIAEDEVAPSEAFDAHVVGSLIEVSIATGTAIFRVQLSPSSGEVLDVFDESEWVGNCPPLHC